MPDLLPVAIKYAARGLSVFALTPGLKIPVAGSRGCSEATTDPEIIRAMWRRNPDAGIGLVPGPRYWVLDVDTEPPKSHPDGWTGLQALEALAAEGYVLPATLTAETPRGGLHLWWLAPDGVEIRPRSTGILVLGTWSGLDVRSVGSYVVAPPTRILVDKGPLAGQVRGYRWTCRETAQEAPAWLLELVTHHEEPERESRPVEPWTGRAVRAERYARAVLDSACEACASPSPGRHERWYRQARTVGGYVSGGHLGMEEARSRLEEAARRSLAPGERRERDLRRTIADGLAAGVLSPCHPPTQER